MGKSFNNSLSKLPNWLLGAIPLGLFLILWSAIAIIWPDLRAGAIERFPSSASFIPDLFFLSDPKSVAFALVRLASTIGFWGHLAATLCKSLLAFALAACGGSLLGWLMASWRSGEHVLLPTVEILRSVPPISLLPVFLLFAGVGWTLSVWLAAFGAFWPVTIAAFYAIKGVDPTALEMGQNLGLTRHQLARYIQIPLALPGLFTGLRIALPIALILVLVAEMTAGAFLGLGAGVEFAKRSFRFDEMIAWIITIGLVGLVLNRGLQLIQRRLLSWHPSFKTDKEKE